MRYSSIIIGVILCLLSYHLIFSASLWGKQGPGVEDIALIAGLWGLFGFFELKFLKKFRLGAVPHLMVVASLAIYLWSHHLYSSLRRCTLEFKNNEVTILAPGFYFERPSLRFSLVAQVVYRGEHSVETMEKDLKAALYRESINVSQVYLIDLTARKTKPNTTNSPSPS